MTTSQLYMAAGVLFAAAYFMVNLIFILWQRLAAPEALKPKLFGTGRQAIRFFMILLFGVPMMLCGMFQIIQLESSGDSSK